MSPADEDQGATGRPVFVAPGAAPSGVQPVAGGPIFTKPAPGPVPVSDDARPWRWYVGVTTVIVAFVAVIGLSVAVAVLLLASGGDKDVANVVDDNEHWFGLGQDALWILVAICVPFLFSRHLRPEYLGLRRPPSWGRAAGAFVLSIVLFLAFTALYSAALGLDDDSNKLLQDTGFGTSVTKDVVYAILYTVAAPVAEELLFRGVLFRSIRDSMTRRLPRAGVFLAALLSGVFFGAIHVGGGQDDFLPVLMALGILLALAYHFSGSIYVPILIHSINNAISTGANSNPSHDWVFWLIGAGPILALALAFLLRQFVRAAFRNDPPIPAQQPSEEPSIV
jgi:membrane protease YdiL (CAAX protease family)